MVSRSVPFISATIANSGVCIIGTREERVQRLVPFFLGLRHHWPPAFVVQPRDNVRGNWWFHWISGWANLP